MNLTARNLAVSHIKVSANDNFVNEFKRQQNNIDHGMEWKSQNRLAQHSGEQ
jgi:hypothetical protein|tara:strand:- start:327 stop:482 length:156 start_codon:yes stop_codon:yes gene_type:complete